MRAVLLATLLLLVAFSLAAAELPTRQTLTVDGQQALIIRDGYGVPHIFADTSRALFYADGYAAAQDRLLQMEKYRRTAKGTLAELMGPAAVGNDRHVREQGYTEAEYQQQVEALEPRYRAILQDYADGVNARIAEVKAAGQVPAEITAAGLELAPWQPTDTAAIGGMMARRFGSGGGSELRAQMLHDAIVAKFGDRAEGIWNDVAVWQDPLAPTTIPKGEGEGSLIFFDPKARTSKLPAGTRAGLELALSHADWAQHDAGLAKLGITVRLGSYAWAIAPQRTSTGNAMLVGGPQMGFTTPQIAHEVHLCGAGYNTMGMGFAGVPGVMIGINERLAWTTTSAGADVEDVFAEKLNPDNPRQYWHKGKWVDMISRQETIKVRGGQPVELTVYRTVHGPLLSSDEKVGVAYAMAYSYWMQEVGTLRAVEAFNRAKDVREFGRACADVTTTHNWLVATQDGDIGYWYCGRVPIRARGLDHRLPTPGTGEYDWQGIIPFDRMPQVVNPKQGYLCNWNNKPAWWWAPGETVGWTNMFRISGVAAAITAKPVLTFTDMRDITKDIGIRAYQADQLKPYLLRAADWTGAWKDPALGPALRELAAWDNHGINQSVAPVIFQRWAAVLPRLVLGEDVAKLFPQNELALAATRRVIDRTFASPKPSQDYLRGRSANRVLIEALGQAVAELRKERGADMSRWRHDQGKITFGGAVPWIPSYSRGTYIQAVEVAKPRLYGVNILPPGQSEDPQSPHYADQRELAGYWMWKPMLLYRDEVEK